MLNNYKIIQHSKDLHPFSFYVCVCVCMHVCYARVATLVIRLLEGCRVEQQQLQFSV